MGKGLGTTPDICVDAFIEAMRKTMPDEQKLKLDRPDVRANIAPLGEAVFDIAVGPAQTRADRDSDRVFFDWLSAITKWMVEMEKWRMGVTKVIADAQTLKALRQDVGKLPTPTAPPSRRPSRLTGAIR
ncbi:hypothetical protein [Roseibium marinum]|uniref:Uncharacterized protein n=1 Tax=Roseibium marinum TaxID=281252 RepID=A0A2S3UNE6_9HYPH|nr:hypothetical protein [Roseibium marinum]POF29083.1 hypothetical protein CLV41_11087 [Roseibium marinum]